MKNLAIITGDLINSSKYSEKTLVSVLKVLKKEFAVLEKQYPHKVSHFTIYRGDSFQGLVSDPKLALVVALQLKAAVNSYTDIEDLPKNAIPAADVRISIGIGEANYEENALGESNGEAFMYSGRSLDHMKPDRLKMALTSSINEVNDEFKVHFKFLDAITDRWSVASAEVVYFLVKGYKEKEIAKELDRSQAAINYRKKAAGWEQIKLLLERYGNVVNSHFV